MCDPITGTLMALSALQSYSAYEEGKFNAEQQEDAFKRNRTASIEAGMREARALNERKNQLEMRSAQKRMDNQLETLRAKGRLQASESGVVQNANVLEREITRQGLRNADSIAANLQAEQNQLGLERGGITARTNSRINSVARGVKPSGEAALINAAANAGSIYLMTRADSPKTMDDKKPPKSPNKPTNYSNPNKTYFT